jgi:hypothetical protein
MALLITFKAYPFSSPATKLIKFKTDYCTGFPEGTFFRRNLWKSCCYDHDLRYWFGGTKQDEKTADIVLKQCVSKKAGSFYGNIMYYGVRTGHYSPIKHRFKWGWGWPNRHAYKKLNSTEKKVILDSLNLLMLDQAYLEEFILRYNLR